MSIKYNNYLKSEWWKRLREGRLKRNNKCQVCGSSYFLQIHHYNYEYKYAGRGSKAMKHTKVLCRNCHKSFHDTYGIKKDMTAEMNHFMKKNKSIIESARKDWKEMQEQEDWLKYLVKK